MINIDKKNNVYDYDDDIDVLWDEIKMILIDILALSEYLEDKDYVYGHLQDVKKQYLKKRTKLIEGYINDAAQKEKNEKLTEINEDKLNDLFHI